MMHIMNTITNNIKQKKIIKKERTKKIIVVNKFSIAFLVLQIWEVCQTKKEKKKKKRKEERILYYNFMYNIHDFYLYKYLKKKRERDFHIWKVKYISVFVCKNIIEQCTYIIRYFAKYSYPSKTRLI